MRPLRFAHLFAAWFIALVIVGLPALLLGRLLGIENSGAFRTVSGILAALVMLIVLGLLHERGQRPPEDPDRHWFAA